MKRAGWLASIVLPLVAVSWGQAFAGYVDVVLADDPLVYWRLEEDAATKSGGGAAVKRRAVYNAC